MRIAYYFRYAVGMDAPEMPGFVYWFWDEDGRLLYIGSTIDVRHRATEHKGSQGWWGQVRKVTADQYASPELARTAEREAIARELPLHNKTYNPARPKVPRVRMPVITQDPDGAPPRGWSLEQRPGGLRVYRRGTVTVMSRVTSQRDWACLAYALNDAIRQAA